MESHGDERVEIELAKCRNRELTSAAVDGRPHDQVIEAARETLANRDRQEK